MSRSLAIPITHHPCVDGSSIHVIEPSTRHCSLCGKDHAELACPQCDPVYSSNVELIDGTVHRRWICRVCLMEGVEPMSDAQEYAVLKGKLAEFKSGKPGGTVNDSPKPSLRVEFPASFPKQERNSSCQPMLPPIVPIVPWAP